MTTTGAPSKADQHRMRLEELGAIVDTLDSLDDEQWDAQSGCEGWRVRDVIGHLLVGYTTPMPSMILKVARRGFNVDEASRVESAAYASAHTPSELLATIRAVQTNDIRKGIAKLIPPQEGVVDHVIHHIDIREPLGLEVKPDETRLRAALDTVVTLGGFVRGKGRAKGLRFESTDLDWSWGDGPLVTGPAVDVLLAVSGRTVGLAGLSGAGSDSLASRC